MSEMLAQDYELFTQESQAIVFNYHTNAIQRMLDYGFACGRTTPSVAAIVYTRAGLHKAFWGGKEILIPIYRSTEEAAERHPGADVFINFSSFRSAYDSSLEAIRQPSIRTIAIIAEGIPERKSRRLLNEAKERNKWVIGPATVGGIKAGAFKIGNTGGTIENIVSNKLYAPGFVGFVSKSGGLSNEMYSVLSLACGPRTAEKRFHVALNEGIAIGGDSYPGTTLYDHLKRYEQNPDIKLLVALGEVGGEGEYQIVEALHNKEITKPLVMWTMGTCATIFPGEVQFGHAGACAHEQRETAEAKNIALREAGAIVPNSFDELGDVIHEVYQGLVSSKILPKVAEIPKPVPVPIDIQEAQRKGIVRKPTNFISTISDDRGEELTYAGVPISQVVEKGLGIGGTIGLLWFKRELPAYASKFLEMFMVIVADHGPAVSGAHNAIVAARAGKDLVSSLASGLLTIGPRFGGAIDGAAKHFKEACDSGKTAEEFVDAMKRLGTPIPGIGHRVKSIKNPDKRVELIKQYAKQHFQENRYLNFALEVESITTKKKGNLILNVDGCIAVCFLDLLDSLDDFTEEEKQRFTELGFLNGLFIIGRCIGLVGHIIDQKQLTQALYRHPWDDIAYVSDDL